MQLLRKGMTKLIGLDYIIQYKKGKKNIVVDALSRCFGNRGCDQLNNKILQALCGSPLGGHSDMQSTYHKVKNFLLA